MFTTSQATQCAQQSQSGATIAHKKRKLDHHAVNIESASVVSAAAAVAYPLTADPSLYTTTLRHHHRSTAAIAAVANNNNVHHSKSPNGALPGMPQNFIRASTIKLLDTYQRCGQKVIWSFMLDLSLFISKAI